MGFVILFQGLVACQRTVPAPDPARDDGALWGWLLGYQSLVLTLPECGYMTPGLRVARSTDLELLAHVEIARTNSGFFHFMFSASGCTPRTATDSASSVTFTLSYHSNRAVSTRQESPTPRDGITRVNSENRFTFASQDCLGGGTISRAFTYDSLNRLVRKFSPADAGCSWGGEETIYEYVGLERTPSRTVYVDSGTLWEDLQHTYQYEGIRLVGQSAVCLGGSGCANQSFTYTYNGLGQLTREERTLPSPVTFDYAYDPQGRIVVVNAPGTIVTYTYNAAGQLDSITDSGLPTTVTFTY